MTITPWPQTDKLGVPLSKMPDCPLCHEDELSMINEFSIFCNICSEWFYPEVKKSHLYKATKMAINIGDKVTCCPQLPGLEDLAGKTGIVMQKENEGLYVKFGNKEVLIGAIELRRCDGE